MVTYFERFSQFLSTNSNPVYLRKKLLKSPQYSPGNYRPISQSVYELCRKRESYPELLYDTIIAQLSELSIVVDYYTDYFEGNVKISEEKYLAITL